MVSNNIFRVKERTTDRLTDRPTEKRPEFGTESKILGSARQEYFFRLQLPGDTPLYKPYRYVPYQRVGFLRRFGLKTGMDFVHFGLESGMVFEGTRQARI